jgi:plastocyanin
MRRSRIIVMVGALAVVAGACSSDTSEPTGTTGTGGTTATDTSSEPAGDAAELTIVDFAFEPSAVTPGPDGVLRVTNDGATTHTFTMDDGSIDEQIEPGQSVEVTVGNEGGFHCEIHPSMTGTVEAT